MSFSQDNGYSPVDFATLMGAIREGINTQFGTAYTEDNFVGTNYYKYFYALVQKVLENETKTAEIFTKLQEYIAQTNLRIQRPSVSYPGLVESFASQGYVASVKQNLEADAGTISICVDVDDADPDYADTKLEICNLIKDYVVAGMVTLGDQVESIVLSNGQSFDFKYALPDYTPILLRLTLTTSDNQVLTIPSDEDIRQRVFDNIAARYRLGWDFEPVRYYNVADAPWAATILLEWSSNGGGLWQSTVFQAAFDDLFTFELGDISVVIDP